MNKRASTVYTPVVMYTIVSVQLLTVQSFTVLSLYNVLQQQSDSIVVIKKQLLALLNKEVVESFCTCTEYFNFFQMLCTYISIVFCTVLQYFAIFYNILQYDHKYQSECTNYLNICFSSNIQCFTQFGRQILHPHGFNTTGAVL